MNVSSKKRSILREAAANGIVLLRNDEGVLPLKPGEKVALFGRSSFNTYCSGTGSGGMVNIPYKENIIDGLAKSSYVKLDVAILDLYKNWLKNNPYDNGHGIWAAEPWNQVEMVPNKETIKTASKEDTVAIVTIGRTAGEDRDNQLVEGGYLLSQQEKTLLSRVCQYFSRVVVICNTANLIDQTWAFSKSFSNKILGLLQVFPGGQETGNAIADVLTGKVVPSGKLTDSIIMDLNLYPSTVQFRNNTKKRYEDVTYVEDIYVGYRFYETFMPEQVLFHFGFGLSYTKFGIKVLQAYINQETETVLLKVSVKNVGSKWNGREVIQVYIEKPQGKIGNPARELVAFKKTRELKPSETTTLKFEVAVRDFASYDDSGISGFPSSYVLEAGNYKVYVGNSVNDAKVVWFDEKDYFSLGNTVPIKRHKQIQPPAVSFDRIHPVKQKNEDKYTIGYEKTPARKEPITDRINENLKSLKLEQNDCNSIRPDFAETRKEKDTIKKLTTQLSTNSLAVLAKGEGQCSSFVTPGTGCAWGGLNEELRMKGVPIVCGTDGPNGVRLDSGKQAMQGPCGTALACTWDPALVTYAAEVIGCDCKENNINCLFGPGMNIHRNPLCGRNFEYFSEDPLVSGIMGDAVCRGLERRHVDGSIKHFACNNMERNRFFTNSIVSERALREIYLKGFEIAIRNGHVKVVMTSYNRVNGFWTASSYDLCTEILRHEWNYGGVVITDWWANLNNVSKGGRANRHDIASMIRAGCNAYMVFPNNTATTNVYKDNILSSLKTGNLTIEELQKNAYIILNYLLETEAVKNRVFKGFPIYRFEPEKNENDKLEYKKLALNNDNLIEISPQEHMPFSIQKRGVFEVELTYRCNTNKYEQYIINAHINKRPFLTFGVNSTEGKWVQKKVFFAMLEPGYYLIDIKKNLIPVEIKDIRFNRVREQ